MIRFEYVQYKNFLSTGNVPIRIDLGKKTTTLVTGKNGAGKSTFIDAITVALYGKSYRRVNKPQLSNSINKKDCTIEIAFWKDEDRYRVVRTIDTQSSKFEIYKNDQQVDKLASNVDQQVWFEETILKMNYQTFCQVVILGSANYVPFMMLQAAARRVVVENILDISVFTEMNTTLKEKVSATKDSLEATRRNLAEASAHITGIVNLIASKEADRQKYLEEIKRDLATLREESLEIKAKIDPLEEALRDGATKVVTAAESCQTKSMNLSSEYWALDRLMTDLEKQIKFFESTPVCSVCKQVVDKNHSDQHVKELATKKLNAKQAALEIQGRSAQADAELLAANKAVKKYHEDRGEQAVLKGKYEAKMSEAKKLFGIMKQYESEDAKAEIENEKKVLSDLRDRVTIWKREEETLIYQQSVQDLASKLLKDSGIKASVIKQYVKAMNQYVNHYLHVFDFYCNFAFDENFEESINARGKQDFTYCSFSMGERMRIDLALLFAWREMARIRSQASTNLLIFDEIFDSSLDSEGADQLLDILNKVATNNSVFVISHRGHQLIEKMQAHLVFDKVNGFSKVVSDVG